MSRDADAIVVGSRCAGSAASIALARAGRKVIALDRVSFPSDTLSTHLLFPGGVIELAELGALERVEALGPPRMPEAFMNGAGISVRTPYTPKDGIDYALCVRRPGLDAALVETAREAGAEVREGVRVTGLVRDGERVVGVETDAGELRAPLVVGADGRRSGVAEEVGAKKPRRSNRNGRACFFTYFEDAAPSWRGVAAQWRAGPELGTAFPCDGGLVLVLLMPPVERTQEFRADPQGAYERTLALLPGLGERLAGSTQAAKVRGTADLPSYFRRSSGPGWALAGDAGHFKDPVTAQGIRDAMRFGRLLGEAAAPHLDGESAALDRALRSWERRRDRECRQVYRWTNRLARAEPMSAFEVELYREGAADPEFARQMTDVFARTREPREVMTPGRALKLAGRALLGRVRSRDANSHSSPAPVRVRP